MLDSNYHGNREEGTPTTFATLRLSCSHHRGWRRSVPFLLSFFFPLVLLLQSFHTTCAP